MMGKASYQQGDALEFLREDHRRIRQIFFQVRAAASLELKKELFEEIKAELDLHCHLEETVFYPSVSSHIEFKDILEECYDEHQEITDLLEEMDETDDDESAMFDDDLEELMDCVEFHFKREEAELFDQAERLLEVPSLQAMGAALNDSREKLQAA